MGLEEGLEGLLLELAEGLRVASEDPLLELRLVFELALGLLLGPSLGCAGAACPARVGRGGGGGARSTTPSCALG